LISGSRTITLLGRFPNNHEEEEETGTVHVRVVRFTDVDPAKLDTLLARIQEADGPPAGVPAHRFTFLHDEEQGTAVVIQYFNSAQEMSEAARVLDAMDASETPGRRTSVDACELKLDLSA
jgi:hypothetical protein